MDQTVDTTDVVRTATDKASGEKLRDRGGLAVVSLIWVAAAFVGGLFVVDAIGALETEPDECYAYAYGSGPGGNGCNPLLDDGYFEVSQTDGLADRQLVTIRGFLFDPYMRVGIAQCSGVAFTIPADPSGAAACDLTGAGLGYTNGAGEFELTMRVRRFITTTAGGAIDCAQAGSTCVLAGGVLRADQVSTSEAAYAAITFDPDLPPIPPPILEVEVEEIDATHAVLTIECANVEYLSISVNLQQERRGLFGSASGYIDEQSPEISCLDGPTEAVVDLRSGSRRIGRGDVTYYVSAYGSDNFESVRVFLDGEFRLRRTPPVVYRTENSPGDTLEILDAEIVGRGEDQRVRVRLLCEQGADYSSINVNISQWSGLDQISGSGGAALPECPGEIEVDVPFVPYNGRLQTGNAQLDVYVYQEGTTLGGGYFFEQAQFADRVRLRGRYAAEMQTVESNPESRITIDEVTRDGISGTVECDEPVMVEIQAQAQQYQGRILRRSSAYSWNSEPFGELECDGELAFDLEWNARLQRGTTGVSLYANGYQITDTPVFPTTTTGPPTTVPDGAPVPVAAPSPTVVPTTFAAEAALGAAPAAGAGAPVPADPAEADEFPARSGDTADGGYYSFVWSDSQGETVRVQR